MCRTRTVARRKWVHDRDRIPVAVHAGGEVASAFGRCRDLEILGGTGQELLEILLVEEEKQLDPSPVVAGMRQQNRTSDIVVVIVIAVEGARKAGGVIEKIVRVKVVVTVEETQIEMEILGRFATCTEPRNRRPFRIPPGNSKSTPGLRKRRPDSW